MSSTFCSATDYFVTAPKLKPSTSGGDGISQIIHSVDDDAVELTFPRGATLMQLANFLSAERSLGKPVIDRTGLEGVFDFKLKWRPTNTIGYVDTIYNLFTGPPPPPPPPGGLRPAGPPLNEALQKQLGLRLVSATTSIDVFVIDRVERPTPN